MYLRACVRAYMYIYTHIQLYMCIGMFVCAWEFACSCPGLVYAHGSVHAHVRMSMCTHVRINMHSCMHCVHGAKHMFTYVCADMSS
jgi:hypothetical protein